MLTNRLLHLSCEQKKIPNITIVHWKNHLWSIRVSSACSVCVNYSTARGRVLWWACLSVCLYVCLSATVSPELDIGSSPIFARYVNFWQRCDTLCTSGFCLHDRPEIGDAKRRIYSVSRQYGFDTAAYSQTPTGGSTGGGVCYNRLPNVFVISVGSELSMDPFCVT